MIYVYRQQLDVRKLFFPTFLQVFASFLQQQQQHWLRSAPPAAEQMPDCLSTFPELQKKPSNEPESHFLLPIAFKTCVHACFFPPVAAVVS